MVQFYLFFNRRYVTNCAVMRYVAHLWLKNELIVSKVLFIEESPNCYFLVVHSVDRRSSSLVGSVSCSLYCGDCLHLWLLVGANAAAPNITERALSGPLLEPVTFKWTATKNKNSFRYGQWFAYEVAAARSSEWVMNF